MTDPGEGHPEKVDKIAEEPGFTPEEVKEIREKASKINQSKNDKKDK